MATTPRSAKIPQWPVSSVIPIAQALSDLAGPASNARIGQQLGLSPAAGKFRSKLGTAGYYGFTRRENDLHVLTPRGEAILSEDPEVALRARREAVMSTGFGHVIRKFSGREPNVTAIAARLEDDYGAPAASAGYQATTLVQAAQEAQLISNNRFDAAAIESVPTNLTPAAMDGNGTRARGEVTERAPRPERPAAPRVAKEKTTKDSGAPRDREGGAAARVHDGPFGPGVQLVVKVDASTWTPQQVVELIRSLREPEGGPSSSESS